MSEQFESMSVIELRQKARELGVKLGAGINKQGIIEKLTQAVSKLEPAAPAPAEQPETPAEEQPALPPRPIRSAAIITDDEEMDEDDVPVLTRNPAIPPSPRPAAPAPTTDAAPASAPTAGEEDGSAEA